MKLKIGIIGFGTVGSGVVQLLNENREYIKHTTGVDIELAKVCDLDIERDRGVAIDRALLTTSVDEVLDSPDIDVVVELIGGISPAKEFILKALQQGKHVVTANKALLATHGLELITAARAAKRNLRFEAAVGGGIPIIHSLMNGLAANEIRAIYGIVNGTCNFILTKMKNEGLEFEEVLDFAIKEGYAEANPSLDVDGIDSAHKVAILASLAFGKYVSFDDVYVEGIRNVSALDIEFADRLGYTIKLLVITKKSNGEIEVRVHPTMIPKNSQLGKTDGVYNAIEVTGNFTENVLFYGRGAGARPTASAVVSDIIGIATCDQMSFNYPPGYRAELEQNNALRIKNIDVVETRYYLRMKTEDRPGVLAEVAKVLAAENISIASVEQLETFLREKSAIIVITTHKAQEQHMKRAIEKVNALSCVLEPVNIIRIEDLN